VANGLRGNSVTILGPKWRLHYYAHLNEIKTRTFHVEGNNDAIGTVGTFGNTQRKPPCLHNAIFSLISYFWLADKEVQG